MARVQFGGRLLTAMILGTILLLTAAATPQSNSQAASDVVTIPFEYARNRAGLVVRVFINGKRALLVLDTGSAHTIIRPELVGLKRSKLRSAETASPGGGMMGDAVGAEVKLQIGDCAWPKYRVAVMDISAILAAYQDDLDGVLGLDFLANYRHITLDLHQHRIELRR